MNHDPFYYRIIGMDYCYVRKYVSIIITKGGRRHTKCNSCIIFNWSAKALLLDVKLRESIPEDQQHELFKWMLEERRKIKPKDPEEKECIDEEKATLKQFIRAKPIPSIKLFNTCSQI